MSLVSVEEEKSGDGGFDYLESPVSDGTIEENFEEELVNAPISGPYSIINSGNEYDEDEDFSDVSQYGIVEVVGDDPYGRKIITVTACKLPNNNQLDHQRLLRYRHKSILSRKYPSLTAFFYVNAKNLEREYFVVLLDTQSQMILIFYFSYIMFHSAKYVCCPDYKSYAREYKSIIFQFQVESRKFTFFLPLKNCIN